MEEKHQMFNTFAAILWLKSNFTHGEKSRESWEVITSSLKSQENPSALRVRQSCVLAHTLCYIIYSNLTSVFLSVAFCPYHIGHFSVVGLGFEEYVSAQQHMRGHLYSLNSSLAFGSVMH